MTSRLEIRDWLPAPIANGSHGHWRAKQKKLEAAQVMIWAEAKHKGLEPVKGRAKLTITLVFGVKRLRDRDNLYSRVKGCVDGLVKGKWIEGDDIDQLDLVVNAEVRPGYKATILSLEPA